MALNSYQLFADIFVRGLRNLNGQLVKAKEYAEANSIPDAGVLDARLDTKGLGGYAPADLHGYTLAAQAHWAVEGAKLAVARIMGLELVPDQNVAKTFDGLVRQIDEAITYLHGISQSDLEAGLDRTVEHPRASGPMSGSHFLLAYAIPHFFYHVATAYGILRNQGVPLRMADYLGDWGKA